MDMKIRDRAASAALAGRKWARNSVLALACGTMLALPMGNVAQASFLKGMMNTLLGDMSNTTSAGAYHNANRGVFSGGSIYARTKIFNTNVMSFTPPSVNGGCGGIDLFGGSFSFINAEQLIQLFRSIVSNAAPVLFYAAVSFISEKLAKIMAKFQDIIQRLNHLLSNSCQLAMGIATDIGDKLGIPHEDGAPSATAMFRSTMQGVKSDWGDVMDMFAISKGGSSSPQQSLSKRDPQTAKDLGVYGNVVWKALQKTNVTGGQYSALVSSFGASAKSIRQEILSAAGSIVIAKPTSASSSQSASGSGSNSTDSVQIQRFLAPKISLKEMVTGMGANGRKLEYWICNDDECENPTSGTLADLPVGGFTQQIYNTLCGDSACSGGIIGKLATDGNRRQNDVTEEEARFISNIPFNLGSEVKRLAMSSTWESGTTGAAFEFGKRLSAVTASYLAHEMVDSTLRAAEQSLNNVQGNGVGPALEQIQRSRENNNNEYEDLKKLYGDFPALYEMVQQIRSYGQQLPFSPALKAKAE